MLNFEIILATVILLVGVRTLLWHLQCWQLREYRVDRMKAWLHTKDGKSYFMPWFFKGLLPRPKFSHRILLITIFVVFATLGVANFWLYVWAHVFIYFDWVRWTYFNTSPQFPLLFWGLLGLSIERSLWLTSALSVLISGMPVKLKKIYLFHQAGKIIVNGDSNIIKIGITGSYGKSSTKELLVHLLKAEFGEDSVLYNPANENTEVAIARLILKNKGFFSYSKDKRKFLVIETGAYKKGEIATVAKMITPQQSIITGLNQQHVELFGNLKAIRDAKFELAEGTSQTVFFNSDNAYLQQIFKNQKIKATSIPLAASTLKITKTTYHSTSFEAYGQNFTLPWPGEFFVQNALLALECTRELGATPKRLALHLKTLKPLKRALSFNTHPQGFTVLRDTYSANPDGVLKAIEHLKNFKGQRVFVSIPLRELGGHALTVHQQIFEKLKSVNATVYWEKNDFSDLGKDILGNKFHLLKNHSSTFKKQIQTLKKQDVVLLESKLSSQTLNLFK